MVPHIVFLLYNGAIRILILEKYYSYALCNIVWTKLQTIIDTDILVICFIIFWICLSAMLGQWYYARYDKANNRVNSGIYCGFAKLNYNIQSYIKSKLVLAISVIPCSLRE